MRPLASLFEKGRLQGYRQGREESIAATVRVRFGVVPAWLEQALHRACDADALSDLLRQTIRAPTLEALEQALRQWPAD